MAGFTPDFDLSRECNILGKAQRACPRHGYSHAPDAIDPAAAPELYEALVGMLRVCPSEKNGMRLAEYDAARAAIAKARGEPVVGESVVGVTR